MSLNITSAPTGSGCVRCEATDAVYTIAHRSGKYPGGISGNFCKHCAFTQVRRLLNGAVGRRYGCNRGELLA